LPQKSYSNGIDGGKRAGRVYVLSADLCDPSAALRFIGFTDVITAEVRRTAEIRRENFSAKPHYYED
jgi:hypothetical protein